MNFTLAIILGIAFGFALDRAQATNPQKIINMLRLKHFHLMKVILFAIGFSSLILFVLLALNIVDVGHLSVKTSYTGVLVGGAILGIGFAIGGYCPGTCIVAAGRGSPTTPQPLRHIQLRLCQLLAVEYPGNLVDYSGPPGGSPSDYPRQFTAAGLCILAGKPLPNYPENSPAAPFSAHLDGVRAFPSILGPGLALAQSGQRTGHSTGTHPMVRVYRCPWWDALDNTDQFCAFESV